MRRGRGLRTNPAKQRAWQDRSRGSISAERERDNTEAKVRAAVFARDGHRCLLRIHVGEVVTTDLLGTRTVEVPDCWGQLSYHHRRKAGASGAYTKANGATLCIGHNGWVEDEPDAALLVLPLLVVREGDDEWDQLGKRAQRHG